MTDDEFKRADWICSKAQDAIEWPGTALREADVVFIESMTAKLVDYGKDVRISEKQWAWLEDIADRAV